MNKLWNDFKSVMLYAGLSREEFQKTKWLFMSPNYGLINVFTVMVMLLAISFEVTSFTGGSSFASRFGYFSVFLAMMFILSINIYRGKNDIITVLTLKSCFVSVTYLMGVLICTVGYPDDRAVIFIVLIVAVPMLFNARPLVSVGEICIADAVFLSVAFFIKDPDVFRADMTDVVTFSLVSAVIDVSVTMSKVQGVQNQWKKNEAMEQMLQAYEELEEGKKHEEELEKQLNRTRNDELTGMYNRRAYEEDMGMGTEYEEDLVCASMSINELKMIGDTLGAEARNEIILGAAECIKKSLGTYGRLYRIGVDEFAAIISCNEYRIREITMDLNREISEWAGELVDNMTMSYGISSEAEMPGASMTELISAAESRMYEMKSRYYSRKGIVTGMQSEEQNKSEPAYTKVLRFNITDDTYDILDAPEEELVPEMGFSDSISRWMEGFGRTGGVHEDDLDEYLEKTDRENMSEYFRSGKDSLHVFYRRRFGDVYRQVMMEIFPASDYTDDEQSMYLYVKNIFL